MLDNELIAFIISTILASEEVANIENLPIKQAFQPTQQGVNTEPTAYMYKVDDDRIGSPLRTNVWDSQTDTMTHTEVQQYATTFQISTLSTQNPNTPEKYTASDILNMIAYILQSDVALEKFKEAGIGIQRIMKIRNTPFIDDRGRHEYEPSMDFIMTHKRVVSSITPIISKTELQILTV